jgi:hypothetical protein
VLPQGFHFVEAAVSKCAIICFQDSFDAMEAAAELGVGALQSAFRIKVEMTT